MNTTNTTISADEMLKIVSETFSVWCAEDGYSDIPRALINGEWVKLPVAHTINFADGRESETIPADQAKIWDLLMTADKVAFPDLYGCHEQGVSVFTPAGGVWSEVYYNFDHEEDRGAFLF